MGRRTLIAANWKMNGDKSLCHSMQSAIAQADNISVQTDVLVCPPYTLLSALNPSEKLSIGSQNVSQYESGAYTGEMSVSMLKATGCEYVIVGHSERREMFGDTDQIVAEKFIQVARSGMAPILCVGESLLDRESELTESVLQSQIDAIIARTQQNDWQNAVIAYEPIWAIGTGKTATPEMAQGTHEFLRKYLRENEMTKNVAEKLRILYGGSMKPENAVELLSQKDIDGGLIGGASLDPQSFISILGAA